MSLNACASTPATDVIDTAEAVLSLPASQVRDAAVEILRREGYDIDVEGTQHDSLAVWAGYRREMDSPWDWLLRARFGVGKSQTDARITALDESSSKLTIHVRHESKASMWTAWAPSEPPLSRGAQRYLRLIKHHLQVL